MIAHWSQTLTQVTGPHTLENPLWPPTVYILTQSLESCEQGQVLLLGDSLMRWVRGLQESGGQEAYTYLMGLESCQGAERIWGMRTSKVSCTWGGGFFCFERQASQIIPLITASLENSKIT
jgi:hypothetical protein